MTPARWTGALLAVAALVAFVVVSWTVWRGRSDPERFLEVHPGAPPVLGPSPAALNEAAEAHMREALDVLSDLSVPSRERIETYRERLAAAATLLERSLEAQPAQAAALARLAAVRWELQPPATVEEEREFVDMIRVASEMAPRVPEVQRRLGELLLRMGRREEGVAYLARAVELSPRTSRAAIEAMRGALLSPDEMLRALPPEPSALALLAAPFSEEGALDRWVEAVEPYLPRANVALLQRYGAACRRLDRPARLRDAMEALAFPGDEELEAERLRQLALGLLALGETTAATRAARDASALAGGSPVYAEALGDVLRAAGEHAAAVAEYRGALAALAKQGARSRVRARLYSKIGTCQDEAGRPDLAYDSYRQAFELDPEEPVARRRLREMRGAAGLE